MRSDAGVAYKKYNQENTVRPQMTIHRVQQNNYLQKSNLWDGVSHEPFCLQVINTKTKVRYQNAETGSGGTRGHMHLYRSRETTPGAVKVNRDK